MAGGELLFEWSPFGRVDITDLDLADRTGSSVNWTRGNALDLHGDDRPSEWQAGRDSWGEQTASLVRPT